MLTLSHVLLFATPCTIARQAPLSMGFSRQKYWSGLPRPSPGDLPYTEMKPRSPALQVDSLPAELPGKPSLCCGWLPVTNPENSSPADCCRPTRSPDPAYSLPYFVDSGPEGLTGSGWQRGCQAHIVSEETLLRSQPVGCSHPQEGNAFLRLWEQGSRVRGPGSPTLLSWGSE